MDATHVGINKSAFFLQRQQHFLPGIKPRFDLFIFSWIRGFADSMSAVIAVALQIILPRSLDDKQRCVVGRQLQRRRWRVHHISTGVQSGAVH